MDKFDTMMEINLTKSMARSTSRLLWGVFTREKYLCKKFEVEEGGGHSLERDIFSGANGTSFSFC